jgi:serine/threonine-protein kinase HipA
VVCLVCLGQEPDEGEYHRACLRELFGQETLPRLPSSVEVTRQRIHDLIADESETKMSISGAQTKALVRVNAQGELEIVGPKSTHILKPPSERFGHLPANEHVTMLIGRRMGLDVPPCGLLRLDDQALVYVVRRFDRNGAKKNTNDFCQLLGVPPEKKNDGTAEQCSQAVQACCAPPAPSLASLFRLFLVAYVLHNGDLHLKNLSVIETPDGSWRLSPAYDLVNTHFYERNAWCVILPIGEQRRDISRKNWLAFAESCGLSPTAGAEVVDEVLSRIDEANALLSRSLLPPDWQRDYGRLLDKRRRSLSASFGRRLAG